MEEQKIEAVLKTLTLEEKASLCSGLTSWTTKPVEGKGVPSVFMADGRILEEGAPADLFDHPQDPRLKDFLSKVL